MGFTAKIFALLFLIKLYPAQILLILILSSVITLIFYAKIFFPMLALINFSPKLNIFIFGHPSKIRIIFSFVLLFNLSLSLLILLT